MLCPVRSSVNPSYLRTGGFFYKKKSPRELNLTIISAGLNPWANSSHMCHKKMSQNFVFGVKTLLKLEKVHGIQSITVLIVIPDLLFCNWKVAGISCKTNLGPFMDV
jgi:hypothetical protein